jgi:superfamily II DNA or RNA helicase
LTSVKYFGKQRDFSNLKKLGGDFKTEDLFNYYDKVELYGEVLDNWKKIADGKKTIIFNCNVAHSKQTANTFNSNGIPALHLDAECPPQERASILSQFKSGAIKVLCNVNILTEGYDLPDIECVIVNRATLSRSLWYQMVGRGMRPSEGKEHCLCIDHGGNVYRHGFIADEVYLLSKYKKKEKIKEPTLMQCPHCEYINDFSLVKICTSCNLPLFPFLEEINVDVNDGLDKEIKSKEAELEEIRQEHLDLQLKAFEGKTECDLSVQELSTYGQIKSMKLNQIISQIWKQTSGVQNRTDVFEALLTVFAYERGYKQGFIDRWLEIYHIRRAKKEEVVNA